MADQTLNHGTANTGGEYKPAVQLAPNSSDTSSARSSATAPKTSNAYSRFEVIPDPNTITHRNLILCFDGTGDQFDADVCISYSSLTLLPC